MPNLFLKDDQGTSHQLVPDRGTTGEFIIGRNVWGIETKRCSREQVHLQIDFHNGKINLTQRGPNPSTYEVAGQQPQLLSRGANVQLSVGDAFSLLEGQHRFVVSSDSQSTGKDHRVQSRAKRQKTSRVASDDDDDSNASDPDFEDSDIEDDDQVASSGSKRLRAHGNANNKAPRVCQYGTSCYRRNPAHFQEFAHPWLSKDDTSVDKHDKAATSSRRQPSVNSTGRPARDVSGSPRGSPTPPLQTSSRPHVKTSTYITPTGQIGASTRSPLNTSRSRSNSVDDPSRSIAKTETQNKDDQSRNQSSRTASGSPSRSNSGDDAGHPTHDTETDKLNNGLRDQSQEPTLSPRRLPESSIAEQEKSEMANIVLQSLPKASDDKPTNQHRAFLAFPSISTEEGAVNLGHAVTAVSAIIRQTLAQNGWSDVRFNLIDTNQVTVESFRKELSAVPGFSAVVGDISHLHTRHGLEADTIVAETSWRWRQSATVPCLAIHNRAGAALQQTLSQTHSKTASVGVVYPVKVESDSLLHQEEHVSQVFFVVGPNMNPKRPDCISEEAEAVKSLSNLYIEIFRQFAASQGLTFSIETNEPVKRSAFELMRGSAKAAVMSAPKAATPQRSNWNDLLLPYCLNPEKYPNDVLSYDTEIVVVRDKYPKARYHLLLMPRTPIDGFSPLGKEHLPLLDRLHNTGQMVITKLRGTSSETFREGFHAVPSMRQLHMHVISQDLESPSLKHKKHWNSFTTDFFIDFEKFRLQLETNGRIKFDEKKFEELLKSPLRCHRCKLECSNMPKLKEHIGKCTKITS